MDTNKGPAICEASVIPTARVVGIGRQLFVLVSTVRASSNASELGCSEVQVTFRPVSRTDQATLQYFQRQIASNEQGERPRYSRFLAVRCTFKEVVGVRVIHQGSR